MTVTDDDGDTGTTTRQVTVAATPPPANQAPTAVIADPTVDGRAVTLTGSGSTDPDGTIAGYSWEFGDGQSATGRRRATPTLPTAPTPSG
ncbi:PKD domain-containing protein [Tessaracoccus sp. HDW20]|nr:PKD domain-containing protein [Tessaracoccus coleopterorum]